MFCFSKSWCPASPEKACAWAHGVARAGGGNTARLCVRSV